ncbi:CoA transferase [Pseudonocardia sp. KRD-184]|uniref:CoA transferase n=1 Tax=Pseudonocardia oceani TaxID=2792013 RepID=A0ABS6U1Y8_9PSEU|nr:CoA transferase [Pseudonocardia oceani]MBW0090240.1 CoA transferase [Pseudonocardia oceani]MBW0097428.1 CoA transferase [Pseudonocardia oceani]MBW0110089.1 CoA transferase [Pseudonocardia oceani]MBW0124203.1 CoA transferase [Pseudonocardia oceani]MBW0126250.1 CoA transferase [Pseudonocardia oceani]
MSGGPLDGVRVVDLTHALAGPYATMLLADLGADVLKVESPAGDLARRAGPYPDGDELRAFGGYFQSVNRGKRSVVLDLKTPEGAAALRSLAGDADVLVENFSHGVMERLGLSYESLCADNPRLVYAAVRGFGDARSGRSPYLEWPAFDVVVQAMAGLMGITGTEDGDPIKVGPGIGDIYPGTMLALGVTSALYEARGTGRGQFVDVAMYDAILALCERIIYQHTYTGAVPRAEGNRHPLLSPFDVLPALDGWVAIAAPADSRWRTLCDLIDRPDLAADPGLATNLLRVARRAEVFDALAAWTSGRTKEEVLAMLGGRVPVGAVRDAAEIAADPHVAARGMVVQLDHPGVDGTLGVAGQPLKFSRTPAVPDRRAPLLDEHGAEVRGELAERRSAFGPDRVAS